MHKEKLKKVSRFNDLKMTQIIQPNIISLVPQYLIEQVEGRSWSVERFYKFAPMLLLNPANRFWVLEDEQHIIKGVLWVVIDILSEKLNLIVFSVDEEYQDNNTEGVIDFLRGFINEFNGTQKHIKLKEKINWLTTEPEKLNGRPLEKVIVEV